MKKVIAAFYFIFLCCLSSAQESNRLNEMLNECLLSYLDWQSDLINKTVESKVYICLDNLPNGFAFSEGVLEKDVKFMSLHNLSGQRELKKNKKYRFVFVGIALIKNHIYITVSGKNVSVPKRNHVHIEAVDCGVFTYDYSCDNQEWVLVETKFGGV